MPRVNPGLAGTSAQPKSGKAGSCLLPTFFHGATLRKLKRPDLGLEEVLSKSFRGRRLGALTTRDSAAQPSVKSRLCVGHHDSEAVLATPTWPNFHNWLPRWVTPTQPLPSPPHWWREALQEVPGGRWEIAISMHITACGWRIVNGSARELESGVWEAKSDLDSCPSTRARPF